MPYVISHAVAALIGAILALWIWCTVPWGFIPWQWDNHWEHPAKWDLPFFDYPNWGDPRNWESPLDWDLPFFDYPNWADPRNWDNPVSGGDDNDDCDCDDPTPVPTTAQIPVLPTEEYTGKDESKKWNGPVPDGMVAIIGGKEGQGKIGDAEFEPPDGFLVAISAGQNVELEVKNGEIHLYPVAEAQEKFCRLKSEYNANGWLDDTITPLPEWGDSNTCCPPATPAATVSHHALVQFPNVVTRIALAA